MAEGKIFLKGNRDRNRKKISGAGDGVTAGFCGY